MSWSNTLQMLSHMNSSKLAHIFLAFYHFVVKGVIGGKIYPFESHSLRGYILFFKLVKK